MMRTQPRSTLFIFVAMLFASAVLAESVPEKSAPTEAEASYALGVVTGAQMEISHRDVVLAAFNEGLRQAYRRAVSPTDLSEAEAAAKVLQRSAASNSEGLGEGERVPEKKMLRSASHHLGLVTGTRLKSQELRKIDFDRFAAGFERGYTQRPSSPEIAKASMLVKEHKRAVRLAGADERLLHSKEFLAKNANREGVIVRKSGLQYEILQEGVGPKPTPLDMVTVNYRHSKADGSLIYDSAAKGHSETFALRGAIPAGWREAFLLMRQGSRYRIYLPPDLGFGIEGSGDDLLPNEVLVTEFELLDIIEPPTPVGPMVDGE